MSECQTKAGNQISLSHSLTVSHSLTLVIHKRKRAEDLTNSSESKCKIAKIVPSKHIENPKNRKVTQETGDERKDVCVGGRDEGETPLTLVTGEQKIHQFEKAPDANKTSTEIERKIS